MEYNIRQTATLNVPLLWSSQKPPCDNVCLYVEFSYSRSLYIQVEKTSEMKKWSRNGKVIKQGRNVYDVLAINVLHAQCVYTLRYNIKGSVATSRAMPTPFYLSI